MNMNNLNTFGEMESLCKLYEAIGKASASFRDIPKTKKGYYGKRTFDYAPYHVIRKVIVAALAEQGVSFMQPQHTEGEHEALTLIVAGHGAVVASTILYKKDQKDQDGNFSIQDFGADVTYYRRYQLQSFFCLEGDADADDLESVENIKDKNPVVSSPVAAKGQVADKKTPPVSAARPSSAANEPEAAMSYTATQPKAPPKPVNPVSVNERLMDAKKQLNWKLPDDFDAFAKEHMEKFPGYVTATKMTNDQKETMWGLLVELKGVVPF